MSLVQFEHRTLAYATLLSAGLLWIAARRPHVPVLARRGANLVTGTALAQASLGIATLLTHVPVELATMHQAGSLALLTSTIWLLRHIRIK
ncbi:hypothetical protein BVRB_028210 [Beta vulgaris subsp. vulgaris]|uniref:Cytochrome oxidase assembly protein n=1 Tax=Beta vulgaris subsp. vulgaris TaxID=3555 RepID=A0A0J8B1I8_BETVV|nr:hypothetical protein BVRB_028210 [Beta vulgaris subsp. vulgaris]